METPRQSTPKLPREPIRKIDWYSIAPWMLLFRVPATVFGWPLVAGAVGVLLFGGVANPRLPIDGNPLSALAAASDAMQSFPRDALASIVETYAKSDQTFGWRLARILVGAIGAVVWGGLAMIIADRVAIALTEGPRRGVMSSLRRAVFATPRLALLVALAMILGLAAFVSWPWLTHALLVEAWGPIKLVVAVTWGVVLLVSLLLTIALAVVVASAMFVPAALAIERCDAFDATSRAFAYTTQRLGRLAAYVTLAALLGVATGAVVELAVDASMTLAYAAFPPLDPENPVGDTTANSIANTWTALFARVVDGYYPAYFFAATTAIYLLLRRDIDGQPIDEMSDAADQLSSAA